MILTFYRDWKQFPSGAGAMQEVRRGGLFALAVDGGGPLKLLSSRSVF